VLDCSVQDEIRFGMSHLLKCFSFQYIVSILFIHNGTWSWIQTLLIDWLWLLLLPFTFSGLLICWELRLLKLPCTVIKQNVCLWRMILIQILKCVFMKVSGCTVKFIFCVSRLCVLHMKSLKGMNISLPFVFQIS